MSINEQNKQLPGVNYNASLGPDDLTYAQGCLQEEITEREKLSIGDFGSDPNYGIVYSQDPSVSIIGSFPFYVSQNEDNAFRLDITPGTAVTPSGMRIVLDEIYRGLYLVTTVHGSVNVVYIEYDTEGVGSIQNRFNVREDIRRIIATGVFLLKIVTISDWESWSADEKKHLIPLAVITITRVSGVLTPNIDMSRTNYTWNRPWFSVVDYRHRLQVGTGSISTPHRISLNDLSAGDFTIWQLLFSKGVLIAKDRDMPNVIGRISTVEITTTMGKYDSDGSVTGRPGWKYLEVGAYPIHLGIAKDTESADAPILIDQVPRRNIIMWPSDYTYPNTFVLYYSMVCGGEPPLTPLSNQVELEFRQLITTDEIAITTGKAISSFLGRTVNLDRYMPIPLRLKVLATETELIANPQVILCYTRLEDSGASINVSITQITYAKIKIGLTGAVKGSENFKINFTLTGLDVNGDSQQETLEFGPSWEDHSSVATDMKALQFLISSNIYSQLLSVTINSRVDDGSNSAFIIYACLLTNTTIEKQDYLALADIIWDGTRALKVYDIRNIKKGVDKNMIEGVEVGLAALAMSPSVSIPSGSVFDYCLVEDCSNYSYIDLCQSTPQHPDEGMTSFSVDSSDLNCVYYSRVFGPKNTVKLAASEIIPYGLEGSSFSVQVRYRRIDTSMWASWRSMSESLGSFGRVGYVFPAPYPVFVQFKIVGTIKGFGMIFYGSLT